MILGVHRAGERIRAEPFEAVDVPQSGDVLTLGRGEGQGARAAMAIERVTIQNLRGIRDGVLEGLSPLSILVGPNNSGKSTVLEGVWSAAAGADAREVWQRLLRRGGPALHAARHVLHGAAKEACAQAFGPDGQRCRVALSIPTIRHVDRLREAREQGLTEPMVSLCSEADFVWAGQRSASETVTQVDAGRRFARCFIESGDTSVPFTVSFVDVEAVRTPGALEEAYSKLEKQRRVARVVRSLQRAMPTLTDLRILKVDEDFVLHAIHGDAPTVPAYLAGDGFKRFLEVAAQVYDAGDGGVVLLEEPESFQHPRYLTELAVVLRDAVALGTQVILSTHSVELIDLLLQRPEGDVGPLPTVHRLRLTDGVLRAVAVSGESARYAREEPAQALRA